LFRPFSSFIFEVSARGSAIPASTFAFGSFSWQLSLAHNNQENKILYDGQHIA
jgi:hypothetical protein